MTALDVNHDPQFDTAEDVSDFMLEETRLAYINRDFDQFLLRMNVPQIVGTFRGERQIETEASVRALYDEMCQFMDAYGVVDLYRRTVAASFNGPNMVKATFVSKYIMTGYAISDEVVAHGELARVEGRWKIMRSSYATDMHEITRILLGEGRVRKS